MATTIEELLPRPSVMGVVNVTPDSFSDGGRYEGTDAAVAHAFELAAEGAAILDIGGESTRPGSLGVPTEVELARVIPVLERLNGSAGPRIPISIDTAKAEVAQRALELGAVMVNDVTALAGDGRMAEVVGGQGAFLCLMHMLGEPRTMQVDPRYDDVVSEVASFLESRLELAIRSGIPEERICLDPGIGFGKTTRHNIELLLGLRTIVSLGRPVLVGVSRKRFLARLTGDEESLVGPLSASVAVAVLAFERGASIIRAHDVREHVEALETVQAFEAVR
ncbi:MAG: dihydropteroate synthase [Gaiellales bacterium]